MATTLTTASTVDRSRLVRRGQMLEYFTLAACSLEAVVSLIAAIFTGSVALSGFGVDSLIEVTSGAAILWRLHRDHNLAERDDAERITLKIVGCCFLALAAYIVYTALSSLLLHNAPAPSLPGISVAIFCVVTMPVLAHAKRQVARGIESAALNADATQTQLCCYLSAILLCGLLLNAMFGWWWADPAAALIMVPIIIKEGKDALSGKACACAGTCH